jgi:hypothetical protein
MAFLPEQYSLFLLFSFTPKLLHPSQLGLNTLGVLQLPTEKKLQVS